MASGVAVGITDPPLAVTQPLNVPAVPAVVRGTSIVIAESVTAGKVNPSFMPCVAWLERYTMSALKP